MVAKVKKKLKKLRNGHTVFIPIYAPFSMINNYGKPIFLPAKITVKKLYEYTDQDGKHKKILQYSNGLLKDKKVSVSNPVVNEFYFMGTYTKEGHIYDFGESYFRAFSREKTLENFYSSFRGDSMYRSCIILSDLYDLFDAESYGESKVFVNSKESDPLLSMEYLLSTALLGNIDCMRAVLDTLFLSLLVPSQNAVLTNSYDSPYYTIVSSILGENRVQEIIEDVGGLDEDAFSIIRKEIGDKIFRRIAFRDGIDFTVHVVRS